MTLTTNVIKLSLFLTLPCKYVAGFMETSTNFVKINCITFFSDARQPLNLLGSPPQAQVFEITSEGNQTFRLISSEIIQTKAKLARPKPSFYKFAGYICEKSISIHKLGVRKFVWQILKPPDRSNFSQSLSDGLDTASVKFKVTQVLTSLVILWKLYFGNIMIWREI